MIKLYNIIILILLLSVSLICCNKSDGTLVQEQENASMDILVGGAYFAGWDSFPWESILRSIFALSTREQWNSELTAIKT